MSIRLLNYSYRFAEQVLNSNLLLKKEIEDVILQSASDLSVLSRPKFNEILEQNFVAKGWQSQPDIFGQDTLYM